MLLEDSKLKLGFIYIKNDSSKLTWWCTLINPVLWGLRQEIC